MSGSTCSSGDEWKGCILNDRYIPIVSLGSGAFATVWLSYDFINDTYYAIKIHNADDYKYGIHETHTYNTLKNLNCPY
jgi:hypothetical protein